MDLAHVLTSLVHPGAEVSPPAAITCAQAAGAQLDPPPMALRRRGRGETPASCPSWYQLGFPLVMDVWPEEDEAPPSDPSSFDEKEEEAFILSVEVEQPPTAAVSVMGSRVPLLPPWLCLTCLVWPDIPRPVTIAAAPKSC